MMPLMQMPDFASPEMWISLVTLTFLEIVLGVDNIIFITIEANKLPEKDQPRARNIGLLLAMLFRIALLFGISFLIAMQSPLFESEGTFFEGTITGQSLILIAGGIFLIYKSTTEIHRKLENPYKHPGGGKKKAAATVFSVIVQIALIDMVFSFDSILTAIGLTRNEVIIIIAFVIAIGVMMLFAKAIGTFVNRHPTIQMLGLAFLILIGFMLVAEGAHLGHFKIAGEDIGSVPKGYLYFAIFFSLGVEFLNMRLRKRVKPVQLHGIPEEAVKEGILPKSSDD